MSSSRLVRGAKTRMFAFVCLICVLGAVLYVFHGTKVRLADVQKQATSCTQQKDSFHAQLQVIFEYKERLEKSLNKEKADHKQTKETLEKKFKDEKEKLENDFNSKNDLLQQKNHNLQGQIEKLNDDNEKLSTEKNNLQIELDNTKKELEAIRLSKDTDLESLKTEWLKKGEECKELQKQLEERKLNEIPEERISFLEKQNFQLTRSLEETKSELAQCQDGADREKKSAVIPSPGTGGEGKSNDAAEVEAPNMSKMQGVLKNFSSTPGINPEALLGLSSAKPAVINNDINRKDEQAAVASAPKKPTQESPPLRKKGLKKATQESVVPIMQPGPGNEDALNQGQGQIPLPPNPHNPQSNILQKPNVVEDVGDISNNINLPEDNEDLLIRQQQAKAQLQEPNIFPDANKAEEEEEQQMGHLKQPKNPENYHGGDYDKEQAEEEDDEGEQIDYDGDRSLKDGKGKMKVPPQIKMVLPRNSGGVMVNPK